MRKARAASAGALQRRNRLPIGRERSCLVSTHRRRNSGEEKKKEKRKRRGEKREEKKGCRFRGGGKGGGEARKGGRQERARVSSSGPPFLGQPRPRVDFPDPFQPSIAAITAFLSYPPPPSRGLRLSRIPDLLGSPHLSLSLFLLFLLPRARARRGFRRF